MKEVKLEESAYQFDAKMSLKQAIPLGLQHVCAMFVGNLTPLLIITSACGIAGGEFARSAGHVAAERHVCGRCSHAGTAVHHRPRGR
mgnify:CR=1 FL=1